MSAEWALVDAQGHCPAGAVNPIGAERVDGLRVDKWRDGCIIGTPLRSWRLTDDEWRAVWRVLVGVEPLPHQLETIALAGGGVRFSSRCSLDVLTHRVSECVALRRTNGQA